MIKTQFILLPIITLQLFNAVGDFNREIPQPVRITKIVDNRLLRTEQALYHLGRDIKIAEAIYLGAIANKIDPALVAVLIETESEFKITARSSKNYKGLMQTPEAMQKQGYQAVDIMLGCCILRDKLNSSYSKGDMLKAIQLYKGGRNNEALRYAKHTMNLYSKINNKIKEGIKNG